MRLEIATHLSRARPDPHLLGDAVVVTEDGPSALVLHGIMGEGGGLLVASMAERAWLDSMAGSRAEPMRARLERGLQAIHTALSRRRQERPQEGWIGVQLAAVALDGADVWLAHIGLPRIYRLRAGDVRRMTEDHAVPGSPNIPAWALGSDEASSAMPAITRESAMPGDRFLLATGRLFQDLPEPELASAFDRFPEVADRAPCAAALATVL